MADSTLDSELFILNHAWGIPPTGLLNVPPGGLTDSRHQNVAEPYFSVGQAVLVKNPEGVAGKAGFAVLTYLQVGTQNEDSVIAVKSAVVPDSATVWYQVTNDPDDCIKLPTGHGGYALGAMTDAYYGWFWTGGICPEGLLSTLAGNYATGDNVAAGQFCYHNLTADYVGIDIADTAGEEIAGFALAADV
ncbi:MAG: hypothetical protein WC789_09320 [Lentisphaeria bacterium]